MSKPYVQQSREEQKNLLVGLQKTYESVKSQGLKLDMSRGKPSPAQLDLSMDILAALTPTSDLRAEDGSDCRNYGILDGIPEAKRLMASMLEVAETQVFVGGGSSLNLMNAALTFSILHPLPGSETPWGKQGDLKFLCPSPGYDRHFNATAHFGIQNIPVPITPEGPDMDMVEQLVQDPSVKGIWCVPKYQNPTGITFSDATVRRLAAMKPAAKDFRIFWDNAYCIHDLHEDKRDSLLPLMAELQKHGNEDMAFQFASFAKITFGGGGIAAIGASEANLAFFAKHMSMQLINSDKVNQLRHTRYFKDLNGLRAHMKKHSALLAPKFTAVLSALAGELGGLDIARWTNPLGGYFISLDTLPGCAKRTVALCKEAGVIITPAGATYPYGDDPEDKNIRIAPSFPALEELGQAADLLCLCVKIASLEKLLGCV